MRLIILSCGTSAVRVRQLQLPRLICFSYMRLPNFSIRTGKTLCLPLCTPNPPSPTLRPFFVVLQQHLSLRCSSFRFRRTAELRLTGWLLWWDNCNCACQCINYSSSSDMFYFSIFLGQCRCEWMCFQRILSKVGQSGLELFINWVSSLYPHFLSLLLGYSKPKLSLRYNSQ